MNTTLFDSPITWYSKKEDVLKWIDHLNTLEDHPDVKRELKKANLILDYIFNT